MPRKLFQVQIQLDVQAITCPGVWLCPNGKVSLQVHMLDSCVQTSILEPVFPLLCHEKFLFCKVFDDARGLSDIQKLLNKEHLYAELIQWKSSDTGNLLATFQSSLADVLYPKTAEGAVAGVDIDLLMEPTKIFPGIIAPKIEVATRTTVEETLCTKLHHKKCSAFVVNPKVVQSENEKCNARGLPRRQKKVCHSIGYHISRKCEPAKKMVKRPAFCFRKAEESLISRKPQGLQQAEPLCKFCIQGSQVSYKPPPSPVSSPKRTYSKLTRDFLRRNPRKPSPPEFPRCICTAGHSEPNCPVCAKYKTYFNETPICSSPRCRIKDCTCFSPRICGRCCEPTVHLYECKPYGKDAGTLTCLDEINKQDDTEKSCVCVSLSKKSLAGDIHKRLNKTLNESCKEGCTCLEDYWSTNSTCACPKTLGSNSQTRQFYNTLDTFYEKLYKKVHDRANREKNVRVCSPLCGAC